MLRHIRGWLVVGSTAGFAFACNGGPDAADGLGGAGSSGQAGASDGPAADYISALTPNDASRSPAEASDDGVADEDEGAERAITEADIIQLAGDTLYALSEYSGLTVVDVADPTQLRATGHYATAGTPFEMYRQDDVAVAMFVGYGHYVHDEEQQQTTWVQSSRVQALDVSTPKDISVLADLSVPGTISDSRLVGDILYLVTTEYGCWGCSEGPSTVVSSFDLSDLDDISLVDQLRYEEPADTYLGQRSIAVTQERIYIGGRDWSNDNTDNGSTIEVVDITDPAGALVAGATVNVAGHIDSRWQMDEYDGTLRVLSQWDQWRANSPPALETYRVRSASDIEKLARVDVLLPRPEVLQSVRFDGERAYAITFEQTDPLFTFDLSDPAAPKQVGELEMPGFVYHMEPRGDRLYAIGFESGNAAGALHASLFDVSDLSDPKQLTRVNFGGDWGYFSEDQNRIHKSFRLLEEGFMVVPFGGWNYDDKGCDGSYQSGIQLVDYTDDTLTLRGVAPQLGDARRAFVHREHLFGVGDDAVQTFDITDPDDIRKVQTLETARDVSKVRVIGDKVLRFGTDWWTDRALLDVTDIDNADQAALSSDLDLSSVVTDEDTTSCRHHGVWGAAYVHGNYAYVSRKTQGWGEDGSGASAQTASLTFFIIDLTAKGGPKLVGSFGPQMLTGQNDFTTVVQTDTALIVERKSYRYTLNTVEQSFFYEVFDLRDPASPVSTAVFELPNQLVEQGWGSYPGGCGLDVGWGFGGYDESTTALVSGDVLASSHAEPLADDATRARYYLDRLDVSDPQKPVLLDKVNVPGHVLHYSHATGRVLTLQSQVEPLALDAQACRTQGEREPSTKWHYLDGGDDGYCEREKRVLYALSLSDEGAVVSASYPVEDRTWFMDASAITDERIFVSQYNTQKRVESGDGGVSEYWTRGQERVFALDHDLTEIARFAPAEASNGYWSPRLSARGTRAFRSEPGELTVYDATAGDEAERYALPINGYGCRALEVRGALALCAQGKQGVEILPLR